MGKNVGSRITVPQIRKEWESWMRARMSGYTGDIVWSDAPQYDDYRTRLRIYE